MVKQYGTSIMPNSLQSGTEMDAAVKNPMKSPKDKWIPWCFVIFFAVIAILDGIFVYMAVSTQTGVVTEHAYEKGLAYNDVLAEAASQPDWQQIASFEDGILIWQLADEKGAPITNAAVTARIKRPVQDGYDFDITLIHTNNGMYKAPLDLPLYGRWQANLSSTWNEQTFRTKLTFMHR